MSELLPTVQAELIRSGLVDYLTTTFALADSEARDGLDRFLSDPAAGMFKGPYVRLRLPFQPAADGWQDLLEWRSGFVPYGHQAAAFARLASASAGVARRPQPTLVTTGTGSGKTEAFLYPILDHVRRARREGATGTKALILYPMNALANDQARRLTALLTEDPELAAVTAAIYTGEAAATKRTSVTRAGLITDRAVIRDTAPDILLTNYKMLDQLLLRREDQALWQQSALSLQYLVLDEFHTYDGAQGTDVAMLLRRLGLALKSHWPSDDPSIGAEDRSRPLGRITPVATSATLGNGGDPTLMCEFAETVFGESFDADAVITESRQTREKWVGEAPARVEALGLTSISIADLDPAAATADIEGLGDDPDADALTEAVLGALFGGGPLPADAATRLDLLRAHPLVGRLAASAAQAVSLDDLVTAAVGDAVSFGRHGQGPAWVAFLSHVVAAFGHVRATAGRQALSVDAHVWIRELTRIDRAADATATFRWGDDGPPTAAEDFADTRPSFPAVYCRHCGRSGWGVGLAPVGDGLAVDDRSIRGDHAQKKGRFRALLHAPGEAAAGDTEDGLRWFAVRSRTLLPHRPPEDDADLADGWTLPVLTTTGVDADQHAKDDQCPACGQEDGIRFLGSAVATLLSVSLSTMFGSGTLDPAEKKALVFSDSVQDAAHRAGFVQARSHTLTLRGVLNAAVTHGALNLDDLVTEVIHAAGDDPFARYRLLAADCADRDSFTAFWQEPTVRAVAPKVRKRVTDRLKLDAALEFGLNSRLGRTLELTGTVGVDVDTGPSSRMAAVAREAAAGFAEQLSLDGSPSEPSLVTWVRGVLDRMRSDGAIAHPWFERYAQEDGNRWWLTGGRPRGDGMPAFPRGRPSPAYPRVGGAEARKDSSLAAVTAPRSWYAGWTGRVMGVSAADGGRLARLLLERLAHHGVLTTITTVSGGTVYQLPPATVVVTPIGAADLAAGRHLLECTTCHAVVPGGRRTVDELEGAPCEVLRCRGTLQRLPGVVGFYRRLYASPDARRVVAREHTSLLESKVRLAYEDGFKAAATSPQSPNVLVATPTLEMGIDIGDLSAVFLASLPRTVAAYVQRVGRAGRLTGNALNLVYVSGRGQHLPRLGDPLSMINGEVRPPATYLTAEEILQRQYIAHLADGLARRENAPHPRKASAALGSSEPGSLLGEVIARNDENPGAAIDQFAATFGDERLAVEKALMEWAVPQAEGGGSRLATFLHRASLRYQATVEQLGHRIEAIQQAIPELEAKKDSPAATEDDRRALGSARAALALSRAQQAHLTGRYWISVLEEYGVLPNYTLLDDGVALDVGMSWVDPDSGEFHAEHVGLKRNAAQAIREFAPGATFYARGLEIGIDAVDLGVDNEAVRPWVLCPACGYAADVEADGTTVVPASCPRCGSIGITDTGQRLDVVELSHVTAEVRRDEASISDRRDVRQTATFQLATTVDVDPAAIVDRWYLDGLDFGCTYSRALDVRYLNLGTAGNGVSRPIAGREWSGSLFRICAGCGKRDIVAGRNEVYEHRAWCRYRTSTVENNRTVALSRTLRTQGILLRLPRVITLGDDFAMISLAAAVLLGMRELLGGHPDHIAVAGVVEPTLSDGSDNHDALLLHDLVPGGTGYLADLSRPGTLHALLVAAWSVVRECPCRHEERLACHRCLLPFAAPSELGRVSRATAERHLRTLLGIAVDATTAEAADWHPVDNPPPDDAESHLEQMFRKVLLDRLRKAGATIDEQPGPTGNTVRFVLPSHRRQWSLTPQVLMGSSKPDFMLQSNDINVPRVAIFTDGKTWHATAAHNLARDDAEKRATLRDAGHLVLAVTSVDLADQPPAPMWFAADRVGQVIGMSSFKARPEVFGRLAHGPIDWLLAWITDPAVEDLRRVGRAVVVLQTVPGLPVHVPAAWSLDQVGRAALCGEPLTGDRTVSLFRYGGVVLVVEASNGSMPAALVLDDRLESVDGSYGETWRAWLSLSNALGPRDWPLKITTVRAVSGTAAVVSTPSTTDTASLNTSLPPEWRAAYEAAQPGAEQAFVAALAEVQDVPVPAVGVEGPEGIPLDLAWPDQRITVEIVDFTENDLADLRAAGWRVLPAVVTDVAAVLSENVNDVEVSP